MYSFIPSTTVYLLFSFARHCLASTWNTKMRDPVVFLGTQSDRPGHYFFFFFIFPFDPVVCGILILQPGIEPGLLQWKHGGLTTGLPGQSPGHHL